MTKRQLGTEILISHHNFVINIDFAVTDEMYLFWSNRNLFVHSQGRVMMNSDFDGCLYLDNCKMHLIF